RSRSDSCESRVVVGSHRVHHALPVLRHALRHNGYAAVRVGELRYAAVGVAHLRHRHAAELAGIPSGQITAVTAGAVTAVAGADAALAWQAARDAVEAVRAEGVILLGAELEAAFVAAQTVTDGTGGSLFGEPSESGQPQNGKDKEVSHGVLFLL